ncbi:unnamed protein product [Notodromas monacha]|uniref:Uncharacterized protein n=1 Tax=Notodromas monacha TaxID=399045 RepID=A0A7R9BWI5_9CRUS|nr:unnamed protein product [Notodromas monacha]CAG0921895.1 unnamed protein product [Notodromas monacha]
MVLRGREVFDASHEIFLVETGCDDFQVIITEMEGCGTVYHSELVVDRKDLMMMTLISFPEVRKTYSLAHKKISALDDLEATIRKNAKLISKILRGKLGYDKKKGASSFEWRTFLGSVDTLPEPARPLILSSRAYVYPSGSRIPPRTQRMIGLQVVLAGISPYLFCCCCFFQGLENVGRRKEDEALLSKVDRLIFGNLSRRRMGKHPGNRMHDRFRVPFVVVFAANMKFPAGAYCDDGYTNRVCVEIEIDHLPGGGPFSSMAPWPPNLKSFFSPGKRKKYPEVLQGLNRDLGPVIYPGVKLRTPTSRDARAVHCRALRKTLNRDQHVPPRERRAGRGADRLNRALELGDMVRRPASVCVARSGLVLWAVCVPVCSAS